MRDAIHDVIDAQEDLAARAQDAVDDLRERLPDVVRQLLDEIPEDELMTRDGADIVEEALEVIAAAAESQLAELTTEAVRTGAELARRRRDG